MNSHSKKSAAKLIHMFPSHWRPLRPTVSGMAATSISSTRCRTPSRDRNPTTILGTPRRNDWIHHFMSLRSKLSRSRSPRISAEVLSSTQWMGAPGCAGLESQTGRKEGILCEFVFSLAGGASDGWRRRGGDRGRRGFLTGVYLTAEAEDCSPHARADYGAVLRFVVDDLVRASLDVIPGGLAPRGGKRSEGLEFVP